MKAKIFLILCILGCYYNLIYAIPATPYPVEITQPDGSTLTIKMYGDEYFHYTTTMQGDYIMPNEEGFYCYTELSQNNQPVAGKTRVSKNDIPKKLSLKRESIAYRLEQLYQEHRNKRTQNITTRKAPMRQAAQKARTAGSDVHGLVLLVEFQDVKFKESSKIEIFENLMNEEGNTFMGGIGSARDYYISQSYGQFTPTFDVIGPISLNNNMSYYGANSSDYNNDIRPDYMVSEACEKASAQGLCDMSDYDTDGDGWVDLVYVIYAGYAESNGAPANTIWPHAWYIYQGAGRTVKIDNVYLDAYACSAELTGTSGNTIDGIGTFCHEYSHTLGLPDFYATNGSSAFGMDRWSVMDLGCYAMDGRIPIGFMSYERQYCGWLELTELSTSSTISLPYIGDNSIAYRISSHNEDQYFTLETRQKKGWDIGLPAEGLMIVKIDYDANIWRYNTVNNEITRQRVQIMAADGKYSRDNLTGDLYPYAGNNEFTSSSIPSMEIYNTIIINKPVTNIDYTNGVTTFDFKGGNSYLEAPVATSPNNVDENGFTAYWSPVSGATHYTLYVERLTESPEAIILQEDFSKFSTSSGQNIAGSSTSVAIANEYTIMPGWSGKYIYNFEGECRIGNTNNGGLLKSPQIDLDAAGDTKLTFSCRRYNQDINGKLTIKITSPISSASASINLNELDDIRITNITINNPKGNANSTLSFESDQRVYIDNILIESQTIKEEYDTTPDTREITGLKDTQYRIENVIPGYYKYKVRAFSDKNMSHYSNEIIVKTGYSGTQLVSTDATRIYSTGKEIIIESNTAENIYIYNMQGIVVAQLKGNNLGKTTYTPETKGIYIVRCGNNVSKVLIQ